MLLEGRAAIVTGGSLGIGKAIARAFLQEGCGCVLAARGKRDLDAAVEELASLGRPVLGFAADVSRPSEVDSLVGFAADRFGEIDVLVNSAGIYGPIGPSIGVDRGEWWRTLEVNLLGAFLCTQAVLCHMVARGRGGKVISLAGGGATAPFPNFSAYAASKAALVRLMETLAEEVREHGIDINTIAPGAVNTRLLGQVLEAEEAAGAHQQRALRQQEEGGVPPERAAELAVFLASDASNGLTGRLLSAVWDDWRQAPRRLREAGESDVFTLRRIVPKDRGLDW